MLAIENVVVKYGNITAVKGVSLKVKEGEVVAVIGPNGAGKSTLLKAICGLKQISEGRITFEHSEISRLPAETIVRRGISLVPEGRRVFPLSTVRRNLEIGAYVRSDTKQVAREIETFLERFPSLKARESVAAKSLSGGEQQMLAICRALMARPKLLLMDEPSMGLAPVIVDEIFRIVEYLKKEGVTILLVEQNARQALSIADRAYVLESGTIKLEGSTASLRENDEVRKAYLGISV
ncbi:MAG: ABC transporter ATP-binding protein [Bacillota bacterium]